MLELVQVCIYTMKGAQGVHCYPCGLGSPCLPRYLWKSQNAVYSGETPDSLGISPIYRTFVTQLGPGWAVRPSVAKLLPSFSFCGEKLWLEIKFDPSILQETVWPTPPFDLGIRGQKRGVRTLFYHTYIIIYRLHLGPLKLICLSGK